MLEFISVSSRMQEPQMRQKEARAQKVTKSHVGTYLRNMNIENWQKILQEIVKT